MSIQPDSHQHQHTSDCYWDLADARWRCSRNGVERPVVDTRDMVVVHTALLREYRLAPGLVAAVEPGDRGRARIVGDHLHFLGSLLHHHHTGEDRLLWPILQQRAPASVAPLLDQMHEQHSRIEQRLEAVTAGLSDWLPDADGAARDRLSASLSALHADLEEHLRTEEQQVLPLAARILTAAEWHAIGEAAVAALPKSKLPVVFGMFAYEGDPEVLRTMVQTAPPLPRLLLPRIAPRVYRRYARAVHRTATP